MKTSSYRRILFGGAAVLCGLIALMWWDAETWQTLHQIWSLPLGTVIGGCLMSGEISGGIAMQFARTVRLASIVLIVVYGLFSLACIPGIAAAPAMYEHYPSFFEQFAAFSGAIALYAATEANTARGKALGRLARLGFGACAVSFGLTQIVYFRATAGLVPKWIPPGQIFWAVLTTVAFGLAAIAILVNRRARLATRLLTLMLALFGVLVWIPRLMAHPEAHSNWSEFGLTVLITGAAWMVAEQSH